MQVNAQMNATRRIPDSYHGRAVGPRGLLLEPDDPCPQAGAEQCEPLPKLGRCHVAAFRLPLKSTVTRSARRRRVAITQKVLPRTGA